MRVLRSLRTVAVYVLLFGLLFVCSALFVRTAVKGHSEGKMEYHSECCSGHDCAPATVVGHLNQSQSNLLPQMTVTTELGTVTVPHNFDLKKIYESKDHRVHACIVPGEADWKRCTDNCEYFIPETPYVDPTLRCLYLPPGT